MLAHLKILEGAQEVCEVDLDSSRLIELLLKQVLLFASHTDIWPSPTRWMLATGATTILSLMLRWGSTWWESLPVQLLGDFLLHPYFSVFTDLLFQNTDILHIIHSFDYLHPLHCVEAHPILHDIFNHRLQLTLPFLHMTLTHHLSHQRIHGLP